MKVLIPFIYAEKEKQNLQTRYPVSEQIIEFVAPCVDGRNITLLAVAHERPGRYVTVAVHSIPVGLRNNCQGNWPRHGTETRSTLSLSFQTQMMSSVIPTGLPFNFGTHVLPLPIRPDTTKGTNLRLSQRY